MIVSLAKEAAFSLGAMEVRPSTREIVTDTGSQIIEPRVMQVLVALARRRGAVVSRDDLIESCWAGRVVGEDAINRCIGAIRRLGDAHGGFSVETVARVGYRLNESSGQRAPAPSKPEPPTSMEAVDGPVGEPVVLAVLAFDNLSNDPDMAWFSDGVSEEIQQTLAGSTALRVIGRGSSFQFRGAAKSARNVAATLNTTHILDGSVRRSGDRVRISAQLIECSQETTLWSGRFDRELADIFALQDEIADAVAAALKTVFSPTRSAEPINPAAYDLYLEAQSLRNSPGDPTDLIARGIALLTRATDLAPRFARAWANLAVARAFQIRYGPEQPHSVTRAQLLEAGETALRLDPGLGAVYQTLSILEPIGRFAERERLNEKALAISPNDPEVIAEASFFLASVGRVDEALSLAQRGFALDPMHIEAANACACMLGIAGAFAQSRELWRRLGENWPGNPRMVENPLVLATMTRDWPWFDALVQAARSRGLDARMQPTLRLGDAIRNRDGSRLLDQLHAVWGVGSPGPAWPVLDGPQGRHVPDDRDGEIRAHSRFRRAPPPDDLFRPDVRQGSGRWAVPRSAVSPAMRQTGAMRLLGDIGPLARLRGRRDPRVRFQGRVRWPRCAGAALGRPT